MPPSRYQMRRGAPGILLSQLMCATCIGGWHDGGAVVSAPSPVGESSSSGCPWLEELDGHKYLKLQQPNNASYHFNVNDDGKNEPAKTTSLYTRLRIAAIRADGIDVLLKEQSECDLANTTHDALCLKPDHKDEDKCRLAAFATAVQCDDSTDTSTATVDLTGTPFAVKDGAAQWAACDVVDTCKLDPSTSVQCTDGNQRCTIVCKGNCQVCAPNPKRVCTEDSPACLIYNSYPVPDDAVLQLVIQDSAAFHATACHVPADPPAPPPPAGRSAWKVVAIVLVVILLVVLVCALLWYWHQRKRKRRRSVVFTPEQAASFFGSSTRELADSTGLSDQLLPPAQHSIQQANDSSLLQQQRQKQQQLFQAQQSGEGGVAAAAAAQPSAPASLSASPAAPTTTEWEAHARTADAEVERLRAENDALRKSIGAAAAHDDRQSTAAPWAGLQVQNSSNVKSARQMFLEEGSGGGTVTLNTNAEVAAAAMAAASWAPADSMGHAAVMGALEESVEVHAFAVPASTPAAAPDSKLPIPDPDATAAQEPEPDLVQQLRSELAPLSARALLKRAEEAGIDEGQIEAADESDNRKEALTALILGAASPPPTQSAAASMAPSGEERVAPSFSVMGGTQEI